MYEKVPQQLKQLNRWVCFKTDKSPVNPLTGGGAMSNNADTWASFEQAVLAVEKYGCKGIGFMLGDGIVGIDLDHCYDIDTGEMSDTAAYIMSQIDSYCEYSISGSGVHILCRGTLPTGARRKNGVEMYDGSRYFTVSGNCIGTSEINDCTNALLKIHSKYLSTTKDSATSVAKAAIALSDGEILAQAFSSRDGTRFRALYNGDYQAFYASQSEADLAFCNMLAFWFGADGARMDKVFRSSGLYRPKWDEDRGGQKYSQITLNKALSDCRQVYTPTDKASPFEDADSFFEKTSMFSPKVVYSMDDTGNALRFKDYAKDRIKYNHSDRAWYVWDGTRWAFDSTESIKRMADAMLSDMEREAFGLSQREDIVTFKAHLRRSKSSKGKTAFITETQHLDEIAVSSSAMDKHKGLFNTLGGTVNLRTGEVNPHRKGDNITKCSDVDYISDAQCPVWIKFLQDVTDNDDRLIEYLQCMLGYCLSGSTKEQCMFFLYGNGANGKSTFLEVVRDIMGDYAMNTQADTLMTNQRSNGGARSDIARLKGARLVTTSETEEDAALNESLVKQLTGADTITARFLYGKDFEFRPEFKIVMATNHKPKVKGTDWGIWRRIRLIPFTVSIPRDKQDKALPDKLRKELSGILNWCIEGAKKWQANSKNSKSGLPPCAAVDNAIEEYKSEMDRLKQFLDDCVMEADGQTIQAGAFYKMYTCWARENGERFPLTSTKFGREMKKRFSSKIGMNYTEYLNLSPSFEGYRFMNWGLSSNNTAQSAAPSAPFIPKQTKMNM